MENHSGTTNNQPFQAAGFNKALVQWARFGLAVILCFLMYYTDAIPMYTQDQIVSYSDTPSQSAIYLQTIPDVEDDITDKNDDDNNIVIGKRIDQQQNVEEEEEEEEDEDEEFTGHAYHRRIETDQMANQIGLKEKNVVSQGPPHLRLLFIVLFSLFEPLPQLSLLTLTKSGPSCSLSIIASIVQPEVAAFYFAIMRGYHQHHTVLFVAYVIVFAANTLFGNLYNALIMLAKFILSEERWNAICQYANEVQQKIDSNQNADNGHDNANTDENDDGANEKTNNKKKKNKRKHD